MNHKIILIAILVLASAVSGCTSKPTTYTQEGTNNRLELCANDHFCIHQTNGFSGLWCTDGELLKLHPLAGGELVLVKDGRDYLDPDGDRWIKK